MLSHWISSWYTTQPQSQEPFNDQYEATEGEWVQVLTPATQQQQQEEKEQQEQKQPSLETNEPSPSAIINEPLQDETNQVTVTNQEKSVMKPDIEEQPVTTKAKEEKVTKPEEKENAVPKPEVSVNSKVTEKPLSRQEKRAMARFAAREEKKQAMLRRRGKNISTNCLPTNPLYIE